MKLEGVLTIPDTPNPLEGQYLISLTHTQEVMANIQQHGPCPLCAGEMVGPNTRGTALARPIQRIVRVLDQVTAEGRRQVIAQTIPETHTLLMCRVCQVYFVTPIGGLE